MENENQDLLDLCRLNVLERNIENHSVDPDTEIGLKVIDREKRACMTRLKHNPPSIAEGAMERHKKENTLNGVYPWTESEEVEVFEE